MDVLRISHFSKKYHQQFAVEELDLQIQSHTILGLIGPNGAGKTTTLNYLAGIIKAESGELEILGEKITANSFAYKHRMGFVLEKPVYFERLTGREYLHLCGHLHQLSELQITQRTDEIMYLFDLTEKANEYIATYSQGMKKKISLAAAILHSPDFLVLDEPLEGIDIASSKIILGNLAAMKLKGKTILVTSHILNIIEKLCTHIAILDKGKLVFHGTMESIQPTTHNALPELSGSPLESLYDQLLENPKDYNVLTWL